MYDDDFLETPPKAQFVNEITDKLNIIKIKTIWAVKQNVETEATTHRLEENICQTHMIMDCYSKYKKNSSNSMIRK